MLLGLLGLSLSVSPLSVMAQEKSYKIGLTGGYTAMTYGGENASDDWEQRPGRTFGGVFLGKPSDGLLNILAEARYVQKGARADVVVNGNDFIVRDRLHTVDTVLLGRLPLPLSRGVASHLLGGVSANVNWGGTREIEGPTGTVSDPLRGSSNTQWALAFGAGIEIGPYAPVSLSLDARYTYGISGNPATDLRGTEGASFRNQGFMLNATFFIAI